MTITRDEWLAAMTAASETPLEPDDPDVMTASELAQFLGVAESTVRIKMKVLLAQGRAERTIKRIRRTNGGWLRVPAYRLKT